MKTTHELIMDLLKEGFERNQLNHGNINSGENVWVMLAAEIPFSENADVADFLPYSLPGYADYQESSDDAQRSYLMEEGLPTHIVRIVLRNNWPSGISDYVDGTDVYVSVDLENQTAIFIWQYIWIEGSPKYEGGSIENSLKWVQELKEPFHIQYDDPFFNF